MEILFSKDGPVSGITGAGMLVRGKTVEWIFYNCRFKYKSRDSTNGSHRRFKNRTNNANAPVQENISLIMDL